MTRKLTLSVEATVIERAKRFARERGTSVSRMVESYLELVSRAPGSRPEPPVLRRLRSSLKGVRVETYHRHLREKYR